MNDINLGNEENPDASQADFLLALTRFFKPGTVQPPSKFLIGEYTIIEVPKDDQGNFIYSFYGPEGKDTVSFRDKPEGKRGGHSMTDEPQEDDETIKEEEPFRSSQYSPPFGGGVYFGLNFGPRPDFIDLPLGRKENPDEEETRSPRILPSDDDEIS